MTHNSLTEELGFDFLPTVTVPDQQGDNGVQVGYVLGRWRAIGTTRGLLSDIDIASFLVRYYEDTWTGQQSAACCLQCHRPLTLCCLQCSNLSAPPATLHPVTMPPITCQSGTMPPIDHRSVTKSPTCHQSGTMPPTDHCSVTKSSTGHQSGTMPPTDHCSVTKSSTGHQSGTMPPTDHCSVTKSPTGHQSGTMPLTDHRSATKPPATHTAITASPASNCSNATPPTTRLSASSTPSVDLTATHSLWLLEKKPAILSSGAIVPESSPGKGCDFGGAALTSDRSQARSSGTNKVKTMEAGSSLTPSFTEASVGYRSDENDDGCGHDDDGEQEDRFGDAGAASSDHGGAKVEEMLNGQPTSMGSDPEELKCLLCSESFTEADQLTVHMQAHSADMAHRCGTCGATFLLPDVLQLHEKMHAHQRRGSKVCCTPASPGTSKKGEHHGEIDPPHTESTLLVYEANGADLQHCCTCSKTDKKADSAGNKCASDKEASRSPDEEAGICGGGNADMEPDPGPRSHCKHKQQSPEVGTQPPSGQPSAHREKDQSGGEGAMWNGHVSVADQQKDLERQQTTGGSDLDSRCGCQHCGESFHSLDALVMHARSHYHRQLLQPHRRNSSRTFPSSALPQARQHPDTKRKTACLRWCEQCGREFSTAASLVQHTRAHMKKRRGPKSRTPSKKAASGRVCDARAGHVCDICRTVCPTAQSLRQHKRVEHKERRKFQCGHCGKELCNMQTLTTHERTHTGAKPYKCPQCPSSFRSSSNLRAHLRTHSGHTPYLCPQCGRGFKEITHLKRHLVSHSGEKPHQCQLCGKAYVHATSLKEHMQSHSPSPKSWVCHQCGKAFANSKKLKVHLKTHSRDDKAEEGRARAGASGGRRFTCLVCGATYQQASSLSRHKRLHGDGASTPHSCPDCGKTFRDRYELKKHGRTHHHQQHHAAADDGGAARPHPCAQCPRSFRDAASCRRHLLSAHGGGGGPKRPHACPLCHKGYAYARSLEQHLQTHAAGTRPHACPRCSKAFFTPWTLRLHRQRHTEEGEGGEEGESGGGGGGGGGGAAGDPKPHACTQCGAAYLRASSLVRHQRLHEAAAGRGARYQCPQCSRFFGDSSHLKRHLLSHSGEKPFVCAACGKAYADSHTLKDHMQVHTGVRSFVCEVCGKAFFNAKTLKEHARSHSDQRPFRCAHCPATYKHLSGLISHRRLHSGLRPFQCGQCGKTFKDYTCYKRHLLTHTHHKPHVCQQCGKAYKDLKNLRHHQAQLHGNSAS